MNAAFLLLSLLSAAIGVGGLSFSFAANKKTLNFHNKFRSELAQGLFVSSGSKIMPRGKNIVKLHWSNKLAKRAQDYANMCPLNHSSAEKVGENMYWHETTQFASEVEYGEMASKSWLSELTEHSWDSLPYDSKTQRQTIGHAVQMAWHNTFAMGCGLAKCPLNGQDSMLVVCRYFPKGNIESEKAYSEGEVCTECPEGFKNCKYGLCERNGGDAATVVDDSP